MTGISQGLTSIDPSRGTGARRLPLGVSIRLTIGTRTGHALKGQPDAAMTRAVCATRASWLETMSRRPSIARNIAADIAKSIDRGTKRRELARDKVGVAGGGPGGAGREG